MVGRPTSGNSGNSSVRRETNRIEVLDAKTGDDGKPLWESALGVSIANLPHSTPADPIDCAPILQPIIDNAEVGAVIQLPVPPAGRYFHTSQIILSSGRTLVGGQFMRVSADNPEGGIAGSVIRGIPGSFAPGEAVIRCTGARAQLRDLQVQATDGCLTRDPGFEHGRGGFRAGAASRLGTSTEQAYQGSQSLKIERVAAGSGQNAIQTFPVEAGQTFTAAGWSYEPDTVSAPNGRIRLAGAALPATDSTVQTVGDWRYHEVTATATSTGNGAVHLTVGGSVGDVVYWDDVRFGAGDTASGLTADYAVLDLSEDSTHTRVFIEGGKLCAYDVSNGRRCNLAHCQVRAGNNDGGGAAISLGTDCMMEGGRKQGGTITLGPSSQVVGAHLTGNGLEHGTPGPNVRIVAFGVIIAGCIVDSFGAAAIEIVAPAAANVTGTDFLKADSSGAPILMVNSAEGTGYASFTGCHATQSPTAGTAPTAFVFGSQAVADQYTVQGFRLSPLYTAAWDFEPYHSLVRLGGVMQPARLS